MTPVSIAEMLERYADLVIRLPSVSRTNPHAAMEAKSELRGEMIAEAKRLRTMTPPPATPPTSSVATITPGARSIGRREIQVVRRARRA